MSVVTHSKYILTKSGVALKKVQEIYLREDLPCQSEACPFVHGKASSSMCSNGIKGATAKGEKVLPKEGVYAIPNADLLLRQMDVLETSLSCIILLQSEMHVVQKQDARIADAWMRYVDTHADNRSVVFFPNVQHAQTHAQRNAKESEPEWILRLFQRAQEWFQSHFAWTSSVQVVSLVQEGLNAFLSKHASNPMYLDALVQVDQPTEPSNLRTMGYTPHWTEEEVAEAVPERIVTGVIRMQSLGREGIVSTDQGDVYVYGASRLNRAVDGDVVVVERLPEDQWVPASTKMPNVTPLDALEGLRVDVAPEQGTPVPSGRVVSIERRRKRKLVGWAKGSLFCPTEALLPPVQLTMAKGRDWTDHTLVVVMDGWAEDAVLPFGHLTQDAGHRDDLDAYAHALLVAANLRSGQFSKTVEACLPPEGEKWSITESDWIQREDLRHLDVMSIDPPGCTDIDDALHCTLLSEDRVQVGVHIADVSHFVHANTALDAEAQARGSTVYLVDRRVDMIPPLLSSNLCSLREKVDRLAFSVIWELDRSTATILSIRFCKSVIRNRQAMTYGEAQERMLGDTKQSQDLKELQRLSNVLRDGRRTKGALVLASSAVRFLGPVDDPVDVELYQGVDTNRLVEEFMLLANASVAEAIQRHRPSGAILRRHPEPDVTRFRPLQEIAHGMGKQLQVSSNLTLAASLDAMETQEKVEKDDVSMAHLFRMSATRCMSTAVYFAAGTQPSMSDYRHYGLAMPLYTHFTSPIRRYSDLMVHRQLFALLGGPAVKGTQREMQRMCNHLNARHRAAQRAGRASVTSHTQRFIAQKGSLLLPCRVLRVYDDGAQVFCPKIGIQGTVSIPSNMAENITLFSKLYVQVSSAPNGPVQFTLSTTTHDDAQDPPRTLPHNLHHTTLGKRAAPALERPSKETRGHHPSSST